MIYNYIQLEENKVVNVLMSNMTPDEFLAKGNLKTIMVDFYNPNLLDTYFKDGIFYEDAELKEPVIDPMNFCE